MPMRFSIVRLGGAGLLGLMLAAPLLLLFLQYESLSFNVHKPEFGTGLGGGSGVGRPPLDRSMVCRRTERPRETGSVSQS